MAYQPKILAFAGSTRSGSFNKKLIKAGIRGAEAAGAAVTHIDLRDLKLPLYDGDDEAQNGLPEGALRLKALMKAHDGILISAPEYNSSISGVLKNAIDWASRPAPNEKPLEPFEGKIVGLLSASPGALGGLRGLMTVRSILGNIGVVVLPEQFALSKAHEAFNDDDSMKDAKQQARAEHVGATLTKFVAQYKGGTQ